MGASENSLEFLYSYQEDLWQRISESEIKYVIVCFSIIFTLILVFFFFPLISILRWGKKGSRKIKYSNFHIAIINKTLLYGDKALKQNKFNFFKFIFTGFYLAPPLKFKGLTS